MPGRRSTKSVPSRPRGTPRTVMEVRRTESPTAASTADLLRKLNNSVGKRGGNHARQKLQADHKASIKKAEEALREASHSNELTMANYRKSQLDRLTALVKRKTEIESELLSRLKRVEEKYLAINKEARTMLESRLEALL